MIDDIPEGEWFCAECVRIGRGRNQTATTSNNTQVRIIARTNFAERIRRNVNANRNTRSVLDEIENRVLVTRRPIRRRVIRRKRVKRVKKRKTTSKKKSKIKKEANIKIEPGTSSSKSKPKAKRRVKRRRIKKRVTKRTKSKTNLLTLNVLKIKNKYKLSNKTSKERILKRIINENDKKLSDLIPSSEKLSNTFHGFRCVDDEDYASIQLTSQASHYFEFDEQKNEEKTKETKPSTSGLDLLNSIMSSQQILALSSSKIKLKQYFFLIKK